MKTIVTSEADGAALNWLVAKCEGLVLHKDAMLNGVVQSGWWVAGYYADPNLWLPLATLRYSDDASFSWPIIDQRRISIIHGFSVEAVIEGDEDTFVEYGPTSLIAAMRCYVASKLGEKVKIPKELA